MGYLNKIPVLNHSFKNIYVVFIIIIVLDNNICIQNVTHNRVRIKHTNETKIIVFNYIISTI